MWKITEQTKYGIEYLVRGCEGVNSDHHNTMIRAMERELMDLADVCQSRGIIIPNRGVFAFRFRLDGYKNPVELGLYWDKYTMPGNLIREIPLGNPFTAPKTEYIKDFSFTEVFEWVEQKGSE